MKVCFLQNVLFDYRVPFYNGLAARGLDITVVHSGKHNEQATNFEQLILPQRKLGPFLWQSSRPSLSDFDVVVAMFDLHWPANVFPVLSWRRPRWVFWGHGLGGNQLGNALRIFLANRADAMVLYTEIGRTAMLNAGLSAEKSYVANNTVEVTNHQGKATRGNSFLYVGRLQHRKRVDLALTAFAAIQGVSGSETLTFDIVGDGDIRPELESLATQLGIAEKVRFHGAITDNAVLKPLFHNAIAYVSPGHLGLGLNHAMAFGVPILSNANADHAPEIAVLNDRNSIMFHGKDDQDAVLKLTQHMSRLAEDEAWAMDLSRQGYADYVNHCSMERMVDGFEAAITGQKQQ